MVRGAVVAYDAEVKFEVLGVPRGPVVMVSCAREMAVGVRRLLHTDVGLGISGVGGPGPDEGRPAGSVHVAVAAREETWSRELDVEGDPDEVVATATTRAPDELARGLAARRADDVSG